MSGLPILSSRTAAVPYLNGGKPERRPFRWVRRAMRLDESEATFSARGFVAQSVRRQQHLESIGGVFIYGYNCALASESIDEMQYVLEQVSPELRGFAFEGASMACCLMDMFSLGGTCFQQWLLGFGERYKHLCWVGAGWACARLGPVHRSLRRKCFPLDWLLPMLVYDGWGFHDGYFFFADYLRSQRPAPKRLAGAARNVFDQGLGRSFWFSCGADVRSIMDLIARFPRERQPDLWSGVGLACCYAGGAEPGDLENLLTLSPEFLPHLRQGVTFAATARNHSGNLTEACVLAARELCGSTPQQLAHIASQAALAAADYQQWRGNIRRSYL